MDLNIKIKDASSKDIEQLLKTIAPTRTSDYQLPPAPAPVQDVSSSIEMQAMVRQMGTMAQVVEGLVAAQQHQSAPPQRVEVQYRQPQPQLEGHPVFPAITAAPTVPVEGARYQSQPSPQTTIDSVVEEVPGYVVPGWVDKATTWGLTILAGGLIAFALTPLVKSWGQPDTTAPAKPPQSSKAPQSSANSTNLLKVPAQKPPSSPHQSVPPPAGVLKFLPAIK